MVGNGTSFTGGGIASTPHGSAETERRAEQIPNEYGNDTPPLPDIGAPVGCPEPGRQTYESNDSRSVFEGMDGHGDSTELPENGSFSIDWWSLEYEVLDDQLTCPICHTGLVDPHTTTCGHTFCFQCLSAAQDMHFLQASDKPFRCPVDRALIGANDVLPAPYILQNLVNELTVKCPSKGCSFQDKRWLLESHLREKCDFVPVGCIAPCEQESERRWRRQSICPHAALPCVKLCGELLLPAEIEQHLSNSCTKSMWECPNCGETLAVTKRLGHEGACPEARSRCPGASLGCKMSFYISEKSAFSDHADNCPLALLAPTLSAQATRIAGLERENRTLRDHLAVTRKQHRQDAVRLDAGLLTEYERMRKDLDYMTSSAEGNVKQMMMLTRENIRMTDDIAFLRNGVNVLHHQVTQVTHALDRRMAFGMMPRNRPAGAFGPGMAEGGRFDRMWGEAGAGAANGRTTGVAPPGEDTGGPGPPAGDAMRRAEGKL